MPQTQPNGYLALPPTHEGKAVLVLHAWWGLNNTIQAVCDRLANDGFIAFAPDLYHGNIANTIAEAEALGQALDENVDTARAELAEAARYLSQHTGHARSKIAVIGFSLGAFYALDISANHPELIRSVVLFYGTGSADFSRSKAAYLGHFAEIDEYEPQTNVNELEADLRRAGRPVTFYRYSGVGHWFFEPDRPAYHPAAASLAWERTMDFLKNSFP